MPSFVFFYTLYTSSQKIIEWILYLLEAQVFFTFSDRKSFSLFPISPSRKRPPRTASLLVDTSFRYLESNRGLPGCFVWHINGRESRDFLLQVFFHESSPPKPPKITLGPFRIFSKIKTFLI